MNDFDLSRHLGRVAAPADFEDRVLAAVRARRREAPARRRTRPFRWALASATAGLLIGFAVLNVFILRAPDSGVLTAGRTEAGPSSRTVSLNEPVDYRHEVRTASVEPGTVYILEQVSDASNTLIKY